MAHNGIPSATRTALAKRMFEIMDTVRNKPVSAKFAAAERFIDEVIEQALKTPSELELKVVSRFEKSPLQTLFAYQMRSASTGEAIKTGACHADSPSHGDVTAVLTALRDAKKTDPEARSLTLVIDSEFVHKGLTQWFKGWESRGWLTTENKPVSYQEDWQEIKSLLNERTATIEFAKANKDSPDMQKLLSACLRQRPSL